MDRLSRSLVAGLLFLPAAVVAARGQAPSSLAERIERITSRPEFRHALWGIEFYSLDEHRALYTQNADKLFTPGSTTKLLTIGTALGVLGPDHRFRTRVYGLGPVRSDGTLDGDLVLVASGDPNLSQRLQPDGTLAFENEDHGYDGDPSTKAVPGDPLLVIRQLAAGIARRVKRIRGRVLVDASLFPEGDRELGTGVVISPIIVNDNLVDVTVTPGAREGAPATISVSPRTDYVRFVNEATTGPRDSRRAMRWAVDSTLADGHHVVTVRGSLPAGSSPILYSYAVPSPSAFAATVLAEALREAGVQLTMTKRDQPAPDFAALAARYPDAPVLAEHVSAPLTEEAKVTLKVSQNLHASAWPSILGAVVGKGDPERTGFDVERDFLTRAGLDVSGAQQGDGAGGDAHFTPAFMVSYLEWMAGQPFGAKFHDALPVLGRDGTLFDIQADSPAAGHVFAKTGTYVVGDPLNRRLLVTAKGLAGYLTTRDGARLAFAIYVNNVSVGDEPDAIKSVVGQALGEVAAAAWWP